MLLCSLQKVRPLLLMTFVVLFPDISHALAPEQILVIANRNAAKSIALAKYYMRKRNIPEKNLLRLFVTDKESCTREEYEKKIATPIRNHITTNHLDTTIRCLVVLYGIPLRITAPPSTSKEQQNPPTAGAAVDSELTLAMAGQYPLGGWLPNPYFLGATGNKTGIPKKDLVLVSRLDGPSESIVKRVIDDSLETEKTGLKGTAYFDARWPDPAKKKVSGYAFYDKSIHHTAGFIKKETFLPVVLEETNALFQDNDCPNAALYCGWYSLGKYIDAFSWVKGAIGYHIASSECTTLKKAKSRVWCKMMLEKGVAVTIGPVAEPYVQGFPVPEIFFRLLVKHRVHIIEAYYLSLPYLSWQMVLIGDPLYRPFPNGSTAHNDR